LAAESPSLGGAEGKKEFGDKFGELKTVLRKVSAGSCCEAFRRFCDKSYLNILKDTKVF
jgi:hypothetical protein